MDQHMKCLIDMLVCTHEVKWRCEEENYDLQM